MAGFDSPVQALDLRVTRSRGNVGQSRVLSRPRRTFVPTTLVKSSPAECEARLASGMSGGKWKAVLRQLRAQDPERSGVVSLSGLQLALQSTGVSFSSSDLTVMSQKFAAGRSKIKYTALMKRVRCCLVVVAKQNKGGNPGPVGPRKHCQVSGFVSRHGTRHYQGEKL